MQFILDVFFVIYTYNLWIGVAFGFRACSGAEINRTILYSPNITAHCQIYRIRMVCFVLFINLVSDLWAMLKESKAHLFTHCQWHTVSSNNMVSSAFANVYFCNNTVHCSWDNFLAIVTWYWQWKRSACWLLHCSVRLLCIFCVFCLSVYRVLTTSLRCLVRPVLPSIRKTFVVH